LKIALIRRTCITYLDGVNRFIALLAEGLKRLGHEVEIFGYCFKSVESERLEEWFREMHGLNTAIAIRTLHEEPCEGDPWVRIAFDWLFKGSKALQSEDFDAVIVSGVIPLRFKPKVAVIHDQGPAFTFNKFYVLLGKIILKHFNEIICVSTKTQQELHSTLKLPCKVIPIPLKLDPFKPRSPNERENIVVHIGTRPAKNPQVSIEAIKILRKRGFNVKLIIVGPPAQFPRTEEVEYAFKVSEEEKIELLCKAKHLFYHQNMKVFLMQL
jgi:glycosyltransferase involved in cell wall biosynthesis